MLAAMHLTCTDCAITRNVHGLHLFEISLGRLLHTEAPKALRSADMNNSSCTSCYDDIRLIDITRYHAHALFALHEITTKAMSSAAGNERKLL